MSTNPGPSPAAEARDRLPSWRSVLAVVAHPDDESFGLGAVLDTFTRSGASVSVLGLTHGEASTLHAAPGALRKLREVELRSAAATLGRSSAVLADFPDGKLSAVTPARLQNEVGEAIRRSRAEGLVVLDPSGVSGHPDHVAATSAALAQAVSSGLPVLGWTVPREVAEQLNREMDTRFVGHEWNEIDVTIDVDRDRQRVASLAHASQAVPTSVLWRRLELLGDVEHLRWLCQPQPPAGETPATTGA